MVEVLAVQSLDPWNPGKVWCVPIYMSAAVPRIHIKVEGKTTHKVAF